MEQHPRGQAYTMEDLDELLHGTVVSVKDKYGFLKADHLLSKAYKRSGDIFFAISPDALAHVAIGQRGVFILNENNSRTSASDIAFATDSSNSAPADFFYVPTDRIPFIHADCGHICFWNEDEDDMELCLRNCLQTLSCGHVCRRQCKEQCPKMCYTCFKKSEKMRKESGPYSVKDLDGFLYGFVVNVQKFFGFVKPERKLPVPYHSNRAIYFSTHETDMTEVREGQVAILMLKMDNSRGPAAREIAFIDKGVDRSTLKPFLREECGHISFTKTEGTQSSCEKKVQEVHMMTRLHTYNRL